jgi:hypothetical protein
MAWAWARRSSPEPVESADSVIVMTPFVRDSVTCRVILRWACKQGMDKPHVLLMTSAHIAGALP